MTSDANRTELGQLRAELVALARRIAAIAPHPRETGRPFSAVVTVNRDHRGASLRLRSSGADVMNHDTERRLADFIELRAEPVALKCRVASLVARMADNP